MELIVWNSGDWKAGKYPDNHGNIQDVRRIVFKSTDKENKKSYYLNLDKKNLITVAKWEPYIIEGNVLKVVIMPKGGYVNNETTINKFEPFEVIRDVTKEKASV